jgi:hypothetical protein
VDNKECKLVYTPTQDKTIKRKDSKDIYGRTRHASNEHLILEKYITRLVYMTETIAIAQNQRKRHIYNET